MGDVRSLVNEMDELTAVTRRQSEYRERSLAVFTETWLTEFTPDARRVTRADGTTERAR